MIKVIKITNFRSFSKGQSPPLLSMKESYGQNLFNNSVFDFNSYKLKKLILIINLKKEISNPKVGILIVYTIILYAAFSPIFFLVIISLRGREKVFER